MDTTSTKLETTLEAGGEMPSSRMGGKAPELAERTGIAFGWVAADLLAPTGNARLVAACERCLFHLGCEFSLEADPAVRAAQMQIAERAVYRTMEVEVVKRGCPHWEDYREAGGLERRTRKASYGKHLLDLEAAICIETGIAAGIAYDQQGVLAGMRRVIVGCEFCVYSANVEVEEARVEEAIFEAVKLLTPGADGKGCPHLSAFIYARGWEIEPELPPGVKAGVAP